MGTPIHHWCKKIIIYTSIGEGILICDRSTQWPIKHYLSTHYQKLQMLIKLWEDIEKASMHMPKGKAHLKRLWTYSRTPTFKKTKNFGDIESSVAGMYGWISNSHRILRAMKLFSMIL